MDIENINKALAGLSLDEQSESIKKTVLRFWGRNGEMIQYIEVLERLFGDDAAGLRASLRGLYSAKPSRHSGGDEGSPDLSLHILKKILEGWPDGGDAGTSFRFVCSVFAGETEKIQRGIVDLFRDRLESGSRTRIVGTWEESKETKELLVWLSFPRVPLPIYDAINSSRLVLAGWETAKKEAEVLLAHYRN